jgi:hypothetical protein
MRVRKIAMCFNWTADEAQKLKVKIIMAVIFSLNTFAKILITEGLSLICLASGNYEPYHNCKRDLYDR